MVGPGMTLTVEKYSGLPLEVRAAIDSHLDSYGHPVGRVYRIDWLGDRWLLHTYAAPLRAYCHEPLRDAPVLIPAGPNW